ncbi:MAG TPA: hypothetical protein VJU17_05945, partial [Gemmatimonadales bacterium]|nr:hypothetical protein [Gemmatimonadales bacterium]
AGQSGDPVLCDPGPGEVTMRPLPAIMLALLALPACQIGTHARNYAPATGPAGATVNLQLMDKSKTSGELLAVESDGFLLLQAGVLTRIPLSRIRSGTAPKVTFDARLGGNTRERLRLVSRYPQGVSPELEGQLLRAYGQSDVRSAP